MPSRLPARFRRLWLHGWACPKLNESNKIKVHSAHPPSRWELEELLVLLEIVLEVPTPVTKLLSALGFLLGLDGCVRCPQLSYSRLIWFRNEHFMACNLGPRASVKGDE